MTDNKDMKLGRSFANQPHSGLAMIEVMVALVILSILTAGLTTMISQQARETKALAELLAKRDLQTVLTAALSSGSVCTYIANNSAPPLTFDSTAVLPQTLIPTLPLYASADPLPGPVVAQIGDIASPYAGSVIINSIQLKITAGSGSSYLGNWEIGFDSTNTVRALKPISVSTTLTVDNSIPVAARITKCGAQSVPSVSYSQTQAPANGNTNTPRTVKAISANVLVSSGDKFLFTINVNAVSGGMATNVTVTLLRDGVQIFYASGSQPSGWTQVHNWIFVDSAATPGLHTYELWTGDDWPNGSWTGDASLVILKTP